MEIDTLRQEDWDLLVHHREPNCVSLFLPTAYPADEAGQNPVHLQSLLHTAERRLIEGGLPARKVADLLEPAASLLRDPIFWHHQGEGLAIFCSAGVFRHYRLPLSLPERVAVGEHFSLRPLLPLRAASGRFYLLALSANHVRLLEATRDEVRRIPLQGVPASLEEGLGKEVVYTDSQLQPSGPAELGRQMAVFHGHGDAQKEDFGDDLLAYFRQISEGLETYLNDPETPLVLATVAPYVSIYRLANRHPGLMSEFVPGSPDLLSDGELHKRAWAVVEPRLLADQEAAVGQFRALAEQAGRTASSLEEILPAAHAGRISVLFLPHVGARWGSFDPASGRVETHLRSGEGDEDLLERAALDTLTNGGTVYAVSSADLPKGAQAAALLRH